MTPEIHDETQCRLGEGPFWHPERGQFFWFDILDNRLLSRTDDGLREWHFGENVSAAGWIDRDTLLVASETALFRYDLKTEAREDVVALEAGNAVTRSNDGRADAHGGFWIGTMAKSEQGAHGAIYRFYHGELRKLYPEIAIPNAMCFTPDGRYAHFCDTREQAIRRVALDGDGWPAAESEILIDLRDEGLNPDGAVCDATGHVWNAQYGAGRIACYDPEGRFVHAVDIPASQTTCPAFGGPDLTTLYCTSAAQKLPAGEIRQTPAHGRTFRIAGAGQGLAEPRVKL